MKTKRPTWLNLLVTVLALVLLFAFLSGMIRRHARPSEPNYKGLALSQWLDDYYIDTRESLTNDSPRSPAYFALRAIGTNMLPTLLYWVEHDPPTEHPQRVALLNHLPRVLAQQRWAIHFAFPERRPYFWHLGFIVLGQDASNAVPALTQLMHENRTTFESSSAAYALACIGPPGFDALRAAAMDPRATCRLAAIDALGEGGTNLVNPRPVLTALLNEPNADVRLHATHALAMLDRLSNDDPPSQ